MIHFVPREKLERGVVVASKFLVKYFLAEDTEMAIGKEKATVDEMLPPPGLEDVGGGDIKAIGQAIANTLQTLFLPDDKFLDMGCGIGRVAIPLTQYLSKDGSYEGFDVMQSAIQHCIDKIAPSYQNFHFTHSDVFNKRYNPNGKIKANEYRFPYDDNSFDFASATSLFTHLMTDAATQYLTEAARVIKPGGRFFATYFLLDGVASAHMDAKKSSIYFPYQVDASCWIHSQEEPEGAVCYEEAFMRRIYGDAGLEIQGEIGWGTWSGRIRVGGYQDHIIAIKR